MTTARPVERRIVSVLFADLVGFTSLSERLDAEDVAIVQDAYFEVVRETVGRHGGQLEKFVGDAAMAVFGAPRVRDDDAERAVRAGLALVAGVDRLGATFGLEGELRLRVGVNSGEAVYGEATSDRGPVTGDTVNVAARLQAAAEPGRVVVGDVTALAVADAVELEPLAPLELKGKAEPVRAFRVAGLYPEPSRERALGRLRAPLLGRDEELSRLLAAVGGEARLLVLVAPPGVGKTRLLDELGAAARDRACVLRARLRPDLLAPFEPVGQLVRSAGAGESLAASLAAAGVAPRRADVVREALDAVIAPVASGVAGGTEERDRLRAAWLEGLDALTGDRAALWLVEDVHWASADLLGFLALAGSAPSPHGRLVVTSSRPAILEAAREWCEGAQLVDLPPLGAADTAAFVRALVGDALDAPLVDRIVERAGGNALFVEELLRTWAGAGVLEDTGTAWRLTTGADDVPLPATVQAIYAGQLDDLPPGARSAARRASVAGRRFPLSALEALGVEDGEEAVGALARRAFVTGPADDPTLGPSYVYRHALLRDAGYASLARGERAQLHLRFADWLASFPEPAIPSLAEVIARHYAAALEQAPSLARELDGRPRGELGGLAAGWFERASATASGFAAWQSARGLAEQAVSLTGEDRPLDRARRLQQLAESTANAVGIDAAVPLLHEALAAYRGAGLGNPAARAGLASAGAVLGRLLRAQTRFVAAEELAAELLAEIGVPDDGATARLLLLRAIAVLNAWDDYPRAEADVERALVLARAAGDPLLELEALELGAQVAGERGDDDGTAWREIERLARAAGRWETVAAAARILGATNVDDEPDGALVAADESAEICVAHGLVESGAWCDYLRAEAHFVAGRWNDALETGLRAVETGELHDLHRVVVRSWFVLLPIALARGREDLIREAYPRFAARVGMQPDSPYARVIATAAHLRFAAIGLEEAFVPDVESRLVSFELDHGGPSWLAAVETLVDAWLAAGELDGAAEALDRMRARLGAGRPSALARATESILRARLLAARGEDASTQAAEALAVLEDRAPWWRAKALRLLGREREAQALEAPLLGY